MYGDYLHPLPPGRRGQQLLLPYVRVAATAVLGGERARPGAAGALAGTGAGRKHRGLEAGHAPGPGAGRSSWRALFAVLSGEHLRFTVDDDRRGVGCGTLPAQPAARL